MAVTTGTALKLRSINAKRAIMVQEGVLDQPELGDPNPHFVYYL